MVIRLFHDGAHHGCAQLQAPTVAGTTPPQTVVFLLDGSGSMASEGKLAHALRAGELCLDHLRPIDTFACVVFHSDATVAIPAQHMSDTNRESAKQALRNVRAEGATHLENGLIRAFAQIPADQSGHIILATDGHPNAGEQDADALRDLVQRLAQDRHVRVDTAGFGKDHNDALLCKLAESAGGVYTFLEKSEAIFDWATTRLGALLTTSLRDVHLEFRGIAGLVGEESAAVTTVAIPRMSSGETKHVLFQLQEGDAERCSCRLEWLDNDGALHEVEASAVDLDPILVNVQVNRWNFVRTVQQASALALAHQLPEARRKLEACRTSLEASASAQDDAVQEFIARLSELVALYRDAPTFSSLGRQRSTEAYRGIRAEEDVGGRGLQSVFTNAGQQGLRRSVSAPVPTPEGTPEGGGGAAAAAMPPPPPRLARTLTTGVRREQGSVWQWENDPVGSGQFVAYGASAQDRIRAAREAGEERLELQSGGSRYMLHFDAGVQVNCATQFIRQLRTV